MQVLVVYESMYGNTHAIAEAIGRGWSMTRAGARKQAEKDDLELDPDAEGPGLRTLFHELGKIDGVRAAAFDTRFDANPAFTGRASKGIARKLRHHGFGLIAEPESFLVDDENTLIEGEDARAEAWARSVLSAAPVGD